MAQSTPLAHVGFRSTLRNRFFLRLWTAQVISQTVQNTINYGSIVLLTQQSHSFTAVGGVIIAFSLPAVLFSVPAGVLVDRMDKRTLLWVSNALRAVASFGFVVSLLIDSKAFVPIYILTFFISIIGQFFGPAEGAAIPLLVREGELVPALSLFNITFSISQALGFVVLGPVIILTAPTVTLPIGPQGMTLTSIHWLFLFIGVMYLICAVLTWLIPANKLIGVKNVASTPPQKRMGIVWHGVTEAWGYVRVHPRLFISVMQLSLGGTLITVIAMIAPLFSVQFMHQPPALAAIVFVPAGLGLVIGSVLMPRIITRVGLATALRAGVIGLSVCVAMLTLTHWLAHRIDPAHFAKYLPYILIMVSLIFIIGLALDMINLPAQTATQQLSPDWIKGRVLALQMMLLNAASIPVVLIVGPAADFLGLGRAMALMAATVFALGWGSITWAERARKREDAQELATAQRQEYVAAQGQANTDMTFKGAHSNPISRPPAEDSSAASGQHMLTTAGDISPVAPPETQRRPSGKIR
jgi:MFS family permease